MAYAIPYGGDGAVFQLTDNYVCTSHFQLLLSFTY
jgi:hypothetical protein